MGCHASKSRNDGTPGPDTPESSRHFAIPTPAYGPEPVETAPATSTSSNCLLSPWSQSRYRSAPDNLASPDGSMKSQRSGRITQPSSSPTDTASTSPVRQELGVEQLSAVSENSVGFRWRLSQLIGRGSCGNVYLGLNMDSGSLLAVKVIYFQSTNVQLMSQVKAEIKLLGNISHPNIVRYVGAEITNGNALYLFMQWVSGGSLCAMLDIFGSLAEKAVRIYTRQILQGLSYLHKNHIIHRDIKGANILIDESGCVKLTDFGASTHLSRLGPQKAQKSGNDIANPPQNAAAAGGDADAGFIVGTPSFLAPEVVQGGEYSMASDVWSVGCTVLQMLTGELPWAPFTAANMPTLLQRIVRDEKGPPIPSRISAEARRFLEACFTRPPSRRPTAEELLHHPFVAQGSFTSSHSEDNASQMYLSGSASSSGAEMPEVLTPDGEPVRFRQVDLTKRFHSSCSSPTSRCVSQAQITEIEHGSPPSATAVPSSAQPPSPVTMLAKSAPPPVPKQLHNASPAVVRMAPVQEPPVVVPTLPTFTLNVELSNFAGVPIYQDAQSGALKTFPHYMSHLARLVGESKSNPSKAAKWSPPGLQSEQQPKENRLDSGQDGHTASFLARTSPLSPSATQTSGSGGAMHSHGNMSAAAFDGRMRSAPPITLADPPALLIPSIGSGLRDHHARDQSNTTLNELAALSAQASREETSSSTTPFSDRDRTSAFPASGDRLATIKESLEKTSSGSPQRTSLDSQMHAASSNTSPLISRVPPDSCQTPLMVTPSARDLGGSPSRTFVSHPVSLTMVVGSRRPPTLSPNSAAVGGSPIPIPLVPEVVDRRLHVVPERRSGEPRTLGGRVAPMSTDTPPVSLRIEEQDSQGSMLGMQESAELDAEAMDKFRGYIITSTEMRSAASRKCSITTPSTTTHKSPQTMEPTTLLSQRSEGHLSTAKTPSTMSPDTAYEEESAADTSRTLQRTHRPRPPAGGKNATTPANVRADVARSFSMTAEDAAQVPPTERTVHRAWETSEHAASGRYTPALSSPTPELQSAHEVGSRPANKSTFRMMGTRRNMNAILPPEEAVIEDSFA